MTARLRLFLSLSFVCVVGMTSDAVVFGAEPRETLASLAKERRILEAAIRKSDLQTALLSIEAIGRLDSPKGVDYLLSQANIRPRRLYDAVVQAIAGSRSDAMKEMLVNLYLADSSRRKEDWERRVMLLDVLGTLPGDEPMAAFSRAVSDPHPKVRLAAIRAIQAARGSDEHKIPAWIESLGASEAALDIGTPHVEARGQLYSHTAKDFRDAKSWKDYWKSHAGEFRKLDHEPEGSIEYGDSAEYYGSAVTSRRVLFIVDTSASMNTFDYEGWPDVPQAPFGDFAVERLGADAGGSPVTNPLWQKWLQLNPLSVRIDRAKAELIHLIDQLPPNTQFNVIAFGSRPTAWQRTLVPVQPASIESARMFSRSLQPDGATAADLALAMAFEGNSLADTIYFLSDGEPSRDGVNILPAELLLEQVEGANRFHRIIIHTLGFGAQGEPFMKSLAEQNGGAYRRIVGPPDWMAN